MASEKMTYGYATGLTTKVEVIRLADSPTEFRYDWADATFKVSGWTTRQQTATEDATTPGRFSVAVDPAAWNDGEYDIVVTDTAIATGPIIQARVSVIAGQFADIGAGLVRGVFHHDWTAIDEQTLAGVKYATVIGSLFRRFFGKVTQTSTEQKVYKNDDVTVMSTSPVSDDGTTQTQGPAV